MVAQATMVVESLPPSETSSFCGIACVRYKLKQAKVASPIERRRLCNNVFCRRGLSALPGCAS